MKLPPAFHSRRTLGSILTMGVLLAPAVLASGTPVAVDVPTYADEVASILHENCATCHRPGQIGPMSLITYEEVRPWAKSIGRNVEAGKMPPWHASGGSGHFRNDRSLSQDEIDTVVRWAKGGAPAGDLAKAPAPPTFPKSAWKLGAPDFVVTLEEVEIEADGPDQFKDLIGKVGLPEDKWVTAIEIMPGDSTVVHHVITYALKGFDFDPTEGWLGAWAAGTQPMVFPEGTGRLLKKGSNIIADMHYHPSGEKTTDVTRVGLHFADQPPAKELTNLWVMNTNFKIPAGAEDHEVRASYTIWQDGKIMSFAPHMHYRGKNIKYVFTYPDGTQETPLEVDDWDFNWQTNYVLAEPIAVPEGTRVDVVAHFDNSAGNPDNPDPSIDVTFGDESYDEMMIGFMDFIVDEGVAPLSHHEIRTRMISQLATRYPGDVYAVSGKEPEKRSEPNSYAPLYLPREGDGVFYVIWDNQLRASAVTDLSWKGDRFAAKVQSPWGPFDLEGEIAKNGEISTVLSLPDNEMSWDGRKVSGDWTDGP